VAVQHAGSEESVFVLDNLKVDFANRQVFINDTEIHLTPIEYRLLSILIKHAGKVITHSQLLREVWDWRMQIKTITCAFTWGNSVIS